MSDWSIRQITKKEELMADKSTNNNVVNKKVVNLHIDKTPRYKCPKCGCVYYEEIDVFIDPDKNAYTCQECGTELITFAADKS